MLFARSTVTHQQASACRACRAAAPAAAEPAGGPAAAAATAGAAQQGASAAAGGSTVASLRDGHFQFGAAGAHAAAAAAEFLPASAADAAARATASAAGAAATAAPQSATPSDIAAASSPSVPAQPELSGAVHIVMSAACTTDAVASESSSNKAAGSVGGRQLTAVKNHTCIRFPGDTPGLRSDHAVCSCQPPVAAAVAAAAASIITARGPAGTGLAAAAS